MISSSTAIALITSTFEDVGTSMLTILGLVLGIGVGYLIFRFGWKKLSYFVGNDWRDYESQDIPGYVEGRKQRLTSSGWV